MNSQLLAQLKSAFTGCQLYLVGGTVRDELLGRETSDLDLATDCLPAETRARVEHWADSVWAVGEKFGTIGLEKHGQKAEITTFRADTYNGESRHPEVMYGSDLAGDLARRDFTINAMARDVHTGTLVDPFSGQGDLQAQVVRFVGEPHERIKEDPLRLMRAIRFCTRLGFTLDSVSERAIRELAGEITRISWERIRDEYDWILTSNNAGAGIRRLLELSLAHHTVSEIEALHMQDPRYRFKDVIDHTLDAVDLAPPDKLLRWTMLLHDIAKPQTFTMDEEGIHFLRHEEIGAQMACQILSRLRQPAEFSVRVQKLIRCHLRVTAYSPKWTDSALRRLMYDLGDEFQPAVEVAKADISASDPITGDDFMSRLADLLARAKQIGDAAELAKMRPLLRGEEVMTLLGIGPGPLIGEIHGFLLSEQIDGRITTAEQAIREVLARYGSRH